MEQTSQSMRELERKMKDEDESVNDLDVSLAGPTNLQWRKFKYYNVEVDPEQDDKSKEILLCSLQRPHSRSFHAAWFSFSVAFFLWFSIVPLLPKIEATLDLTKAELWDSTLAGFGSTILVRLILGPLCDVYGPRVLVSGILIAGAIPTACTGFVNSARGLIILRAFIGINGGVFVMNQFWTSRMFAKNIVGTANGLAAGWGNVAAGTTNLIVTLILLPMFTAIYRGNDDLAWRTVCVLPAMVGVVTGIFVYFRSDDSPKGNYSELKKQGVLSPVSAVKSFREAATDLNTWLLCAQYACSFGVELTMTVAAEHYFHDVLGQSKEAAASLASIFGWLNLFARALGGALSDFGMQKYGMRGRLWIQSICLLGEGCFILIFEHSKSLGASIITLVIFSLFVQAADGTCFGIVPYVNPRHMGSVIGIVGAGGNVGAVCFGWAIRNLYYEKAFLIMGLTVMSSSLLSVFISIRGHRSLLWGVDRRVNPETGEIVVVNDTSSRSGSRSSRRRDANLSLQVA
ncbi:hypothetical protein MPSEU_000037500 [Mayamaea pseudoterrestris]|nr:hypothetical protein MPSEU_000037500 [Mayamaea pseudoterrestris]